MIARDSARANERNHASNIVLPTCRRGVGGTGVGRVAERFRAEIVGLALFKTILAERKRSPDLAGGGNPGPAITWRLLPEHRPAQRSLPQHLLPAQRQPTVG